MTLSHHIFKGRRERKGTLPCNDTGILLTRSHGGLARSRTKQPRSSPPSAGGGRVSPRWGGITARFPQTSPGTRGRTGGQGRAACQQFGQGAAPTHTPPRPRPARPFLRGGRAPAARALSPCCRRSGGAVPSRGLCPPAWSVCPPCPRGALSRVLGRRSAPRSGSPCGPCGRQPSSRRTGPAAGAAGHGPGEPARSERRLPCGPLRRATVQTPRPSAHRGPWRLCRPRRRAARPAGERSTRPHTTGRAAEQRLPGTVVSVSGNPGRRDPRGGSRGKAAMSGSGDFRSDCGQAGILARIADGVTGERSVPWLWRLQQCRGH